MGTVASLRFVDWCDCLPSTLVDPAASCDSCRSRATACECAKFTAQLELLMLVTLCLQTRGQLFQIFCVCIGAVSRSVAEGLPGPLQLQAQRKPGEGHC